MDTFGLDSEALSLSTTVTIWLPFDPLENLPPAAVSSILIVMSASAEMSKVLNSPSTDVAPAGNRNVLCGSTPA